MTNHITMTQQPLQTKSGFLTIDAGTSSLPEGVVPSGVSELRLEGSAPTFSAQAIDGIENLMVPDLNAGMFFPATLKRLFIANYTGSVPLPLFPGLDVFICALSRSKISPGYEHFLWLPIAPRGFVSSDEFYVPVGSTEIIKVFGLNYNIIKRVPRSKTISPAPVLHFKLNIGNLTLRSEQIGSIKELALTDPAPKFEAETIAGLDSLVITDLNGFMAFPETLKWLIIESYSGRVPLPKVQNICIHADRSRHVKTEIEHYIFYYRDGEVPIRNNDLFECTGKPEQIVVCGDTYMIRKRVPKAKLAPVIVSTPVIVPAPIASVQSDQAVHAEILQMLKGLQEAITGLGQILGQASKAE